MNQPFRISCLIAILLTGFTTALSAQKKGEPVLSVAPEPLAVAPAPLPVAPVPLPVAPATVQITSAGALNPLLPGYYADPTIVKYNGIYYIYATTDNEMLASGVPSVWYSKDFCHWYNYIMEIPSLSSVRLRNFWAPDILQGDDGRYYLYFGNCQAGCNIYGYVSDTPTGPWKKLDENDTPVIANGYPREGFPSLDAQFFRDDDGKIYAYWGTWVHYNKGYAVGQLDPATMASVGQGANIPLDQTPEPFEAAYLLKRNHKYILMYSGASCHDETYNVRYAWADSPYGPFTPGANNPILSTNADKTVHGPGHHSVLKEADNYYIVYHRHDYPFTGGGMSRQVCIDSLIFENDTVIRTVVPTHRGIAPFEPTTVPPDLAFGAKAEASSSYRLQLPGTDFAYLPAYATDNNNVTLWKAADGTFPQSLTLDLGKEQQLERVTTQFEFAGYYYQYTLHTSRNGKDWSLYADRSDNRTPGCPMIDNHSATARYLKLTVLATEKTGNFAAVWNLKAYGSCFELPLQLTNRPSSEGPGTPGKQQLLFGFDLTEQADQLPALRHAAQPASTDQPSYAIEPAATEQPSADTLLRIPNLGSLGGHFVQSGELSFEREAESGIPAIRFEKGALTLDRTVPQSLAWNGAFSVAVWVKNPTIQREGECLVSWCNRRTFNLANSYNALFYNSSGHGAMAHLDSHFDMRYRRLPSAGQWHHLVVTFDGVAEKIYVDGQLDNACKMTLASAIDNARILIGRSDTGEYYTGYMASARMYDYALTPDELTQLLQQTRPKAKP